MQTEVSELRCFADFEVDLTAGELRKAGMRCKIQEKPYRVLAALLETPGKLVTREELRQHIWSLDTFVDFDQGINVAVKKLRDVLCDSSETPRLIETVAGKGYRFIARVSIPSRQPSTSAPRRRRIVLWAIASAALVGLVVALLIIRKPAKSMSAPVKSIAVLPLDNLSGDANQEYFADGMTDLLTADLSQIASLRVISRTSVMQYKKTTKTLPQIARELNIDAAVEGSVQRFGARVRVTAQLVDARTDRHLWAATYERDLTDTFALQDEVTDAIANELRAKLTADEQSRLHSPARVNPAAHDAYLRGVYEWNRWEPGARKAVEYFSEATRLDPNYALAYAGLADGYSHFGIMGMLPPKEAWGRAKAAATRAVQLDDTSAEAHAALAYAIGGSDWDWGVIDAEYRRAIALNPNYATARHWYGLYLAQTKRFDEGISETSRAQDLDPLSVLISASLGRRFYLARRYDEAIGQFQKTLQMDPNFGLALSGLGAAYVAHQRYPEAILTLEKATTVARNNPETLPVLGYAYGVSGDRRRALATLKQLRGIFKDHYLSPYFTAMVLAGLGEKDHAIAELERGFEDRSNWMILINTEPMFDSLRSDPRFQEIIRKMNFPR